MMGGYIGTKAVTLSTTTANVGGDSTVGGDLTVDTNTLYVDSANNRVGIGTTSPSELIHGNGSSVSALLLTTDTYSSGTLFKVQGDGAAFIYNRENSFLRFGTNNLERLRIDSSGSLRLGTTGNEGITNRLTVKFNGAGTEYGMVMKPAADNTVPIYFQNASGGSVGSISITSSSTSYNTSSDHRLKENVTDVTDGITRVKQLEPKRFNFIADPDRTVDGFLAHEAQAVVPEAVTGTHNEVDDDGNAVMQGIDQSKLVPLLTAALKESIAKIEALEARVTALEGN